MVANFYLSSLCFSSLLLLLLLLQFQGISGGDLVDNTCKRAAKGNPNINYKFCMNSIGSIPKAHWVNRRGLGLISINLSKSNSTDTTQYIEEIMVEDWDPYVKSCLTDCLELYQSAVSSLTEAFQSFTDKWYYEANIQVSAAMTDAMTCEDGFKDKKGVVSPLTKRNKDMSQLGAIVLSIINMCDHDFSELEVMVAEM